MKKVISLNSYYEITFFPSMVEKVLDIIELNKCITGYYAAYSTIKRVSSITQDSFGYINDYLKRMLDVYINAHFIISDQLTEHNRTFLLGLAKDLVKIYNEFGEKNTWNDWYILQGVACNVANMIYRKLSRYSDLTGDWKKITPACGLISFPATVEKGTQVCYGTRGNWSEKYTTIEMLMYRYTN